jgi:release factor glutamine methyltransferase
MTSNPTPLTIHHTLHQAAALLTHAENPHLDAEILLAHVLEKPRSYLFAWPESLLTASQAQQFQQLLARRLHGEPIAHILGEKEFWSLTLSVTRDTLIPRPDTELLVERVLQQFPEEPAQTIADLGTGTGAIALAIAKERPGWQVVATDLYPATLRVAQYNAHQLAIENIQFYAGDWCAALPAQKFDILVSNPPYIAIGDPHLVSPALSYDPPQALISGKEGLDAIHCIIEQAPAYLMSGGWLFLEHGYNQALAVREKMEKTGYTQIVAHPD